MCYSRLKECESDMANANIVLVWKNTDIPTWTQFFVIAGPETNEAYLAAHSSVVFGIHFHWGWHQNVVPMGWSGSLIETSFMRTEIFETVDLSDLKFKMSGKFTKAVELNRFCKNADFVAVIYGGVMGRRVVCGHFVRAVQPVRSVDPRGHGHGQETGARRLRHPSRRRLTPDHSLSHSLGPQISRQVTLSQSLFDNMGKQTYEGT